jgi:FAD/FMN-containing dehydrogenase
LQLVEKLNPNQLHDVVEKPFPKVMLFVEFDNPERVQKKILKKARKILERYATHVQMETDLIEQEKLWAIRHSSAVVSAHSEGRIKALPIIEDGVVPPERFGDLVEGVYQIFARNHLQAAIWGHAGDANLHMQPFLDLSQVGDRQTAFRVMEEYYSLVLSLGGSTTGQNGDGRLRAPYLPKLYGPEVYDIFQKIKQIFDPYAILNPGVKIDVKMDDVKRMIRTGYTIEHLSDHLPRS